MNLLKEFRRRRSIRKSQKPTLDPVPPIPATPVTSLKPAQSPGFSVVEGQEKGSQVPPSQPQSSLQPQPQLRPRTTSTSSPTQPQPHPQQRSPSQQRQQFQDQPQVRERRRMPEDGMQQGTGFDERGMQRRPDDRMRQPPMQSPHSQHQQQPPPPPHQRPYPQPHQPYTSSRRHPGPPPKTAPAAPVKVPAPAQPDLLGMEGLGVVDRYPRAFLSPRTEFMTTSLQGRRDSWLEEEEASPAAIATLAGEVNHTPRRMSLRSQRSFVGRPIQGPMSAPNGSRANTMSGDPRMQGGMLRTQSAVSLARPSSCLEAQMDPRGSDIPLTLNPEEYIGPDQRRPTSRPGSRMRPPSAHRMARGPPPPGFQGGSFPPHHFAPSPMPRQQPNPNQQQFPPRNQSIRQPNRHLSPNPGQFPRPSSSKRSPSRSPSGTIPSSPVRSPSQPATSSNSLSPGPMSRTRSIRNPSNIPTIAHIPFRPRNFPKHQLDCMQLHSNMVPTPVQHAGVSCALCVRLAEEYDLEMKCCNWCALKVCSECALAVQTWGGLEEVEKAVEEAHVARKGGVMGDDVSSGKSSTSENSTGASSRTSWGEEVMMSMTKGEKVGGEVKINTVEIASA